MKRRSMLAILLAGCSTAMVAQGYDAPLTMQGLHRTAVASPAARGAGSVIFGRSSDVSSLFADPAGLTRIEGLQISFTTERRSTLDRQDQRFGGLQGYTAFTPLMMGTTGQIPDPPDSLLVSQTDSVQRPFDAIGPQWSRSATSRLPIRVFAAMPLEIGGLTFVVGAGMTEYVNLDRFYQNNNSMSPSVLSVLDGTISTLGLNTNPYLVQWYQYRQERVGSINAYGGSVAARLSDRWSVGVSGAWLDGETDDQEVRVGRGRLAFFTNSLRISKEGMTSTAKTGTSSFSGTEFTISASYTARSVMFAAAITPPSTITRSFRGTIVWDSVAAVSRLSHRVDSIHVTGSESYAGEDRIDLPWRASVGVNIFLKEGWRLGLSYEVRPYRSAKYTDASGVMSQPWLASAILSVGTEFRAAEWLTLRAGATSYDENFSGVTPPLRGEPVNYPVYAVGCGLHVLGATIDLAYEYADRKFIDTWANAASINRQFAHTIVAGVSYRLPSW
jgi:opacity protein-like surface antigen